MPALEFRIHEVAAHGVLVYIVAMICWEFVASMIRGVFRAV